MKQTSYWTQQTVRCISLLTGQRPQSITFINQYQLIVKIVSGRRCKPDGTSSTSSFMNIGNPYISGLEAVVKSLFGP